MNSISATDIRRAAMDLLARREHSAQELKDKLAQKFLRKQMQRAPVIDCVEEESFSSSLGSGDFAAVTAVIDEQVARLTEEKLQSDERFVESFVNRKKSLGHGPKKIRQELWHKHVSEVLINTYLDDSDEQWRELARQVYQKKFGGKKAGSYQEKAKRQRFMLLRGFSDWMIERE